MLARIKTKNHTEKKINAKISKLKHYGMGYTIRNLFSLLDISLFHHFFFLTETNEEKKQQRKKSKRSKDTPKEIKRRLTTPRRYGV